MNSLSKIIVTGGAGFIGSHLAPELLARGYEILIVDNLYSGRREYVPAGAGFIDLDLARADESTVSKYSEILSGCRHPPCGNTLHSTLRRQSRRDFSGKRTLNRCDSPSLTWHSTQKLVAASTADVYPLVDRAHVESEVPAPNNPYGLSKFLLEEVIAGAARTNPNLSCVALRLFNVYGPRDTNPHVVPTIIGLLCSRSPEIRVGATESTRDFVHVDDVVQAICTALLHDTGKYDVFNVGTGQGTSIGQVLRILLQAAGDRREVVQDKNLLRAYDRSSLTSDITKIGRILEWHPTVFIEDGLTRLAQQAIRTSS